MTSRKKIEKALLKKLHFLGIILVIFSICFTLYGLFVQPSSMEYQFKLIEEASELLDLPDFKSRYLLYFIFISFLFFSIGCACIYTAKRKNKN